MAAGYCLAASLFDVLGEFDFEQKFLDSSSHTYMWDMLESLFPSFLFLFHTCWGFVTSLGLSDSW